MTDMSFSSSASVRWSALLAAPASRVADLTGLHWQVWQLPDGVIGLLLDRAHETTNTLSEAVLHELDSILARLEFQRPSGIVLASAKASGFAAGADVRDFLGVVDAAEVATRMRRAHAVVDRLAAMPMPTVALLHGHCLGGGLELALACRHRLAVPEARLGLPEVLLGLHPGLGGTYRLPQRIDPLAAMRLMLTGKTLSARRARDLGLVDLVVPERHVVAALAALLAGTAPHAPGSWWRRGRARVLGWAPVRRGVAAIMRRQTARLAPPEQYPAPHRLIDLWAQHGAHAATQQAAEIASFAHVLVGPTAQQLLRVFLLREGLRRAGKDGPPVQQVHVVGAGTMGAGIAAWCAAQGLRVTLADRDPEALAEAVGRAHRQVWQRLTPRARQAVADRLIPDPAGAGVERADLVIEAIVESVDAKRALYAELWPRLAPHAVLASNTSSIPLEALGRDLPDPGRLVGIHFFNPVHRMTLVELVTHGQVASATVARAQAFCRQIQRLPVPVASAPGFVVNRVLSAYLVEAFLMRDEGIAAAEIDRAARHFGMPMGPLELADQVGLDVCLAVARQLRTAFPAEVPAIPTWLEQAVARGHLGTKSGQGIYRYDARGRRRQRRWRHTAAPASGQIDRLVLPWLNLSVRVLREGVIDDPDTLDAALIFGTGFAPFRGGPLQYARSLGKAEVVARLQALASRHGARFTPDPGWDLPNWLGRPPDAPETSPT